MLSSFYMLALGLVISSSVFIIELFEAKVKSTKWYNKVFRKYILLVVSLWRKLKLVESR